MENGQSPGPISDRPVIARLTATKEHAIWCPAPTFFTQAERSWQGSVHQVAQQLNPNFLVAASPELNLES